jgi:hypothetical protein
MLWWQCRVMRRGMAWALALCAAICVAALSAGCKAAPNPLPGRWEGENKLTGRTVYWEFLPDGRLFTDNFSTKHEFRYRVEQPDILRISFSGKFTKEVQPDELVYHFELEADRLIFIIGGRKSMYTRVPGS